MTDHTSSLVDIDQLTFYRGEHCIFDNISLTIPTGKVTTIMGPSGSGKTTLLKLISGQLNPDAGQIMFDGDAIPQLSIKQLYRVRRKMGMLFQSGALFTNLNVYDNVAFPLREHTRLNEAMIRDLVLMKLEAVGLRGAAHLKTSELSGGMSRRVAVARTIALDPKMLMYDEPFAGQDPITMGVLAKLVKLLNDALGLTSVLVSHDVKEAAQISDHLYLLAGGKVVASGAPQAIFDNPSQQVQQFMNGLPDGPVPFHYPTQHDLLEDLLSQGGDL